MTSSVQEWGIFTLRKSLRVNMGFVTVLFPFRNWANSGNYSKGDVAIYYLGTLSKGLQMPLGKVCL